MTQKVWNNYELTLSSSGDEVTFYKGSGTDTAVAKYLNFQADAIIKALMIVTDKNALLISINGEEPNTARTLVADKGLTISGDAWVQVWNNFKIRAASATTDVKVTAFAGL